MSSKLDNENYYNFHQGPHEFHIPVMGTSFTIDTPLKVAPFGINSVVSIGDDELCEQMREHYSKAHSLGFSPIQKTEHDYRAKRITAYLDLLDILITNHIETIKTLPFGEDNDLSKYFNLLPDNNPYKKQYELLNTLEDKELRSTIEKDLRAAVIPGKIEVNIMTKLDKPNYDKDKNLLPTEFSDALSALRGFANSTIESGIVFSAGFNRNLYSYISNFDSFFADKNGYIKKKIILKVSDYRSSCTQGKFLAKKGLWVSEHRIESGLNCGGHAFASQGFLLGPILKEFKDNRDSMSNQLRTICNQALENLPHENLSDDQSTMITVQGGIGTSNEHKFLIDFFNINRTGWGTPFLLVPEATTVDKKTIDLLINSTPKDLYTSEVSPLGVPFNTIKNTESDIQKQLRVENNNPGSPCPKGYLVSNTEFSKKPVCTASSFYQKRKIKQLKEQNHEPSRFQELLQKIVVKSCLCEDLAASALINNDIEYKFPKMPTICPGPNIAYFNKISTLYEMVNHIYGKLNIIDNNRSNMFVNELKMYIDHLVREIRNRIDSSSSNSEKYLQTFYQNIKDGIDYYLSIVPELIKETKVYQESMKNELNQLSDQLDDIIKKYPSIFQQPILNGSH